MDDRDPADRDYWEALAGFTDLTIEGQRLIAQEIVCEARLAWRSAVTSLRDLAGITARRRSLPPA